MKVKRIIFSGQIIIGLVLGLFVFRYCTKQDYTWSDKRIIIKGTLRTKPTTQWIFRGGSKINIEINESPIIFQSPGYYYSDYMSKEAAVFLKSNDSIQLNVLEYDYKRALQNPDSLQKSRPKIEFYGLESNHKQLVDKKALLDIEQPNGFALFLIIFSFCSILIITGYIKLMDNL